MELIANRWELLDKLGHSGQGQAYLARDSADASPNPNERFVLKKLKRLNQQALGRFRNEIDACLLLKHPNIVRVVDSKVEKTDEPYLVTRYCEGGELTNDIVKTLNELERLRMFRTICDAVSFAHNHEVIHRDIKPRNIFIDGLETKSPIVGDFGLCFFHGVTTEGERLTQVHEKIGGTNFQPPEGELGVVEEMRPSFDVYSLGKLLYWLISGGRYLTREYFNRAPQDLRTEITEPWIHRAYEIFERSICEDPRSRYQNAGEMLLDVESLIDFIDHDARYLDAGIDQSCVFCRNGRYQFVTDPDVSDGTFHYNVSRKFGFDLLDSDGRSMHERPNNVGSYSGFLIGHCETCGNVQYFRIKYTRREDGTFSHSTDWRNLPTPSRY